ncbi:MAG: GldM family protein [Chitinophagales bacterium]
MTEVFPREKMEDMREGSFDQLITSLPIYDLIYKEPDEQLWVMNTFDKMPSAGAIAMLSQIQSDIRSSENKLIEELKILTGTGIPFDIFKAKIVAPSTYILKGEKFKADLFLSASSSQTDNIVITANGRTYRPGPDGMVNFEELANTVGQKSIHGNIAITNTTTGKTDIIPFDNFSYTVSDPFANVSPTKMNVLYKGLDNPITASAAGVLAQDLQVSITNGSIKKVNGQYLVNVSQLGDTKIIIKDEKGRTHGEFPFRVKRVPDPIAEVAKRSGGNVRAAEFRAQKGLNAEMVDFVFDLKYEVVNFDMVYMPENNQIAVTNSNRSSFNNTMLNHVQRANPGDRYAFENIKVKGPDGEVRNLQPITFKIM